MIDRWINTNINGLIEKALDASTLRNKVIADNLANVDTPGFKRSEVKFEDELTRALNDSGSLKGFMTNERHIPIGPSGTVVTPRVELQKDISMRNDGNNVDIDREMAALAKNTILYNALVQEVNGEFQKLKTVINGR